MFRRLFSLTAALATVAVLGAGPAQAEDQVQEPRAAKRVYNSMQIAFDPDRPDAFCTIGAVGNDDYGRKIAISAGHCLSAPAYADRELRDNIAPVYHRQDIGYGPIGWVRYFKDPEGSMTGHLTKDYMVIELVPEVTLSSQGPYLKQTGVLEVPGGTPSPNALSPALNSERLLGAAWFNNNELVVSGQLGIWYGRITNNSQGVYQAHPQHKAGDSGGPTIWHVPGSAYPSEANGFHAEGPWAGITKGIIIGIPPYVYTSSANILADLRARDAADPADVFGAGFEVTANP
ncbi:hypothetical protein ACFZBM_31055 [Streptomyces lavendulae]|uniref:Uncharacterized protein n=1 Tax=Streptomyces lavendulae subsp. lavendulae TaxID=58340 RepID=A0A2K8PTE4_STRLA|nr:hypothetical protein [Streptomyces lavendulae]ATZ29113.1 hypothetical protein SLAV_36740 [Streptomyces lavendulae subsp. lavendulae]QUQ58933.1 hypothetical protein SLLC_34910 [Streptomyces lavendulae subsp. lavendulae]GLW03409.1 hypothetical protein Slala05_70390 [Streptomyces lavendulae subsp. lavendulae]